MTRRSNRITAKEKSVAKSSARKARATAKVAKATAKAAKGAKRRALFVSAIERYRMFGYAAYNFDGDGKDPVISRLREVIGDVDPKRIESEGGPKRATLNSWFHGKTRKPYFSTVVAALRAAGKGVADLGDGFAKSGPLPELKTRGRP